jgi:hypothetical protein
MRLEFFRGEATILVAVEAPKRLPGPLPLAGIEDAVPVEVQDAEEGVGAGRGHRRSGMRRRRRQGRGLRAEAGMGQGQPDQGGQEETTGFGSHGRSG